MSSAIHDGFSDTAYEPVAQTFFGFRAFKVGSNVQQSYASGPAVPGIHAFNEGVRGGLRGIFKSQFQWGADVNVAECLRYTPRVGGGSAVSMVNGKPHSMMLPDCSCGFWAYTNGEHMLSCTGPAVLGVIEGWGRCVLGPDGFRAEKARIVALAFPSSDDVGGGAVIDSVQAHVADAVTTAIHVVHQMFAGMALGAWRLTKRDLSDPPPLPKIDAPPKSPRPWELVDDRLREAVRTAYPCARVFDSVAEMHREFPLSDLRALLPKPKPDCGTGDGR